MYPVEVSILVVDDILETTVVHSSGSVTKNRTVVSAENIILTLNTNSSAVSKLEVANESVDRRVIITDQLLCPLINIMTLNLKNVTLRVSADCIAQSDLQPLILEDVEYEFPNRLEDIIRALSSRSQYLEAINIQRATLLSGYIPNEIADLQNLEVLHIDHPSISGELPYDISDIQSLDLIDVVNTAVTIDEELYELLEDEGVNIMTEEDKKLGYF